MPQFLPPLRLTGASVLRDGEMQRRSLSIDEGRLTTGPLPEVALPGYLLLPGIIDLHSDGFAPRLGARVNWPSALAAADRRLAAQGITTAFLAQGWSWEGGLRSPDQAEAMLAALDDHRPVALTDLRAQLRAETHLTDQAGRLLEAVRRHQLHYVIFNNHLGQALAGAARPKQPCPAGAAGGHHSCRSDSGDRGRLRPCPRGAAQPLPSGRGL